ncbi:hypothetical protein ACHAXR_004667 [Thalassiosira sp. AJA248-18]
MILRRARSSFKQRGNKSINGAADLLNITGVNSDYDLRNVKSSRRNDTPKLPSFLMRFRYLASSQVIKQRRHVVIATVLFMGVIFIFLLQIHAFVREYQGPLDHVTTLIRAPYFGMNCPGFSSDDGPINNSTNVNANIMSWDCNDLITGYIASFENESISKFPPIFMVGARGEDEDTFHSWRQTLQLNVIPKHDLIQSRHLPHLERINTLKMSNQYAMSGGALRQSTFGNIQHTNTSTMTVPTHASKNPSQKHHLCRKMKWEHRLFAVYQTVLSRLLTTYPNDPGFVIIEDDATLRSPNAFVQEICNAHLHQLEFYSLYRSPLQWKGRKSSSCIYQHGTVAFYIRRSTMEKIVSERRRGSFCRFPIDMYISKMGPWYATRREIVVHLDAGRIGSV